MLTVATTGHVLGRSPLATVRAVLCKTIVAREARVVLFRMTLTPDHVHEAPFHRPRTTHNSCRLHTTIW